MIATTDIAVLDVADVELAADPAHYVIQACERAKSWLAHALEHGGIEQIAELKSQAEAIRVYTMSKQLGKDAELSAAEIVRRAERGIGIAVRRGQGNGEFKTSGDAAASRLGKPSLTKEGLPKRSANDFFASNDDKTQTYVMADADDASFDEALAAAKADGNLSRRNVVGKVRAKRQAAEVKETALDSEPERVSPDPSDRTGFANMQRRTAVRGMAAEGYTSKQIADRIGRGDNVVRQMARDMGVEIVADKALGRSGRAIDPNRVVRETVHALEGLAMGVGLVLDDLGGLDAAEVSAWTASLTDSIRVLNRLVKQMKERSSER